MTGNAHGKANNEVLERSLLVEREKLEAEIERHRKEIEALEMACQAKENRLVHVKALLATSTPAASNPPRNQSRSNATSTPTARLLDMAEQVLRDRQGEPMYYRDLAEELIRQGAVISGKDPAASLVARMTQADKGKPAEAARFVRPTSRGFYALREDYPQARNVGAKRKRKPNGSNDK